MLLLNVYFFKIQTDEESRGREQEFGASLEADRVI